MAMALAMAGTATSSVEGCGTTTNVIPKQGHVSSGHPLPNIPFLQNSRFSRPSRSFPLILIRKSRAAKVKAAAEPDKGAVTQTEAADGDSSNAQPTSKPPKKPVYSSQIVRADKEMCLDNVNYLSVGYLIYDKGLEYIYKVRGEVLDIRIFETGEFALASDPSR